MTQTELDTIQSQCACRQIDARNCAWVRAGMPWEPHGEGGDDCCECPCHAEIRAATDAEEGCDA